MIYSSFATTFHILVGRVLSATEILDIELLSCLLRTQVLPEPLHEIFPGPPRPRLSGPLVDSSSLPMGFPRSPHPPDAICQSLSIRSRATCNPLRRCSTTGWGGLLTHSGRVYSIGHRWTEPHTHREINTLEVRAALLAIQHFLPQLKDVHIILKSDNTTALATLRHRRSHNFQRNQIVSSLFRTLRSCRSSLFSCEYISTHENPPLSRSKPLRAPVLTACSPSACYGRGSPRNGAPWPTWNQ